MQNKTTIKPARVRFAPSPTGLTHLGSGRTALYDYLLAKQTKGQFILRIEDTDQKRFVEGAEEELIESLHWLGLEWDEGPDIGGPHAPYRQSERKQIYLEHAKMLIDIGHAFYCFCTPERLTAVRKQQFEDKQNPRYDGACRNIFQAEAGDRVQAGEPYVIRYKMPREGTTKSYDILRGEISVSNDTLDDSILIKSNGLAVYHLAAMVDDHLMGITHIIRGSEWLPSFPLHSRIYSSFGWEPPEFVHLSVFLKPSGKGKMSKRDTSVLKSSGKSIFIQDLKELGYVPEAVVNWIALMGWSYDDRTEFFTMDDLIEKFSLAKLNPAPAAINFSKLDHFNGLHIRNMDSHTLAELLVPFFVDAGYNVRDEDLLPLIPLIQQRLPTLDEGPLKAGFFFKEIIEPAPLDLIGKKMTAPQSIQAAKEALSLLKSVTKFTVETLEKPMRELADKLGLKAGQLFGIVRVAVIGQTVSPPLFESMAMIDREIVLQRLETAINQLESLNEDLT